MRFIILFFIFFPLFLYAKENDTIVILHINLKIRGNIYRSEIIAPHYDTLSKQSPDNLILKVYNSNGKFIFYTLKDIENDCNSEFLELGKYEITDTSIIFYSWWGSVGGCCARPGVMEKEYVVNDNRLLKLKTSIVVETPFDTKVSELNKEDYFLQKVVPEIEKDYDGKFVIGEDAITLIEIAKQKLSKEIIDGTKDWHAFLTHYDYRISVPQ